MTAADTDAAAGWLAEHRDGVVPADALAFFDSLPTVALGEMIGRWRGSGLHTGSPLDGLLEAYGWYGKEFIGVETVHPLLFRGRGGRPRPVDPRSSRSVCCVTTRGWRTSGAGADGVRRHPPAPVHEPAEGPAAHGAAPRRRHGGDALRLAARHRLLPAGGR